MLVRPKGIDAYGGLEPYLNDPEIRESHNGYGFTDYVKNRDLGAAFIRKLFRKTSSGFFYQWEKRYKLEHKEQ